MENIRDLISSVLSKAAQGLKLKPSEREKFCAWKVDLDQAKRDNHDRVQEFKEELRTLEARALKLDDELKRESVGVLQKVVSRELEQVCLELEQKEGRMDVLFANIKRQAAALDKIAELDEALRRGVSETQADDLAVELAEAFEELERTDEAMRDAEEVAYRRIENGKVDVEKHPGQMRGVTPAVPSAAKSSMAWLRRRKTAPGEE